MDRLNILYVSYREWARRLLLKGLDFLQEEHSSIHDKVAVKKIHSTADLKKENLKNYDLIFFIGWSEIIPAHIVTAHKCICLHPSPLPQYAGGSPLQHQVINGETSSAVTFFLMDEGIDSGPILSQTKFSLEGDLEEIFSAMIKASYPAFADIIINFGSSGKLKTQPQNLENATFYRRRKPSQSEIKTEDLNNFTATELYNKIRALQKPYPNAYILCKDKTKLYITSSRVEE